MKISRITLLLFLSLVLGVSPGFAQEDYAKPDQDPMLKGDSWGEPAFSKPVDGAHIQVWIQKSGDEPMGQRYGQPAIEVVETGGETNKTHRVRVEVRDETEKSLDQAKVEMKVTSPSGKSATEPLNHAGEGHEGSLSLEESGIYKINVTVTTSDGKKRSADFTYKV